MKKICIISAICGAIAILAVVVGIIIAKMHKLEDDYADIGEDIDSFNKWLDDIDE